MTSTYLSVASPVYRHFEPEFVHGITTLGRVLNHRAHVEFGIVQGDSLLERARNTLVHNFKKRAEELQMDEAYLLFIDADTVFAGVDILSILDIADSLENREFIIGTQIPQRIVKRATAENPRETDVSPSLYEVDSVGMGFTLISAQAIRKTEESCDWFNGRSGDLVARFFHNSLDSATNDLHGEDITFCIKARKMGVPVYVAKNIFPGHVTTGVKTFEYD